MHSATTLCHGVIYKNHYLYFEIVQFEYAIIKLCNRVIYINMKSATYHFYCEMDQFKYTVIIQFMK